MSEQLTFAMGEFIAELPCDRHYIKNHMWALEVQPNVFRFGFSAYAVRLLQDIYFIDFDVTPGSALSNRQEFGNIESKKAESGMYAPIPGQIVSINERLLDDPSLINVDKYGDGWLLEITPPTGDHQDLGILTPEQYVEHLHAAWDVAQRTIKGQANTDEE
ncbi:Glycine cleavage system H protein [Pirellula sp. SH-Sr6A]|uniref:glycine cleavage system protein H n=1 Tax=Pirellula sp. SH-Sr6A TaxID=1632865 RepID=UPI00078C8D8D|nr:glycine cleavage system protein H [Pirellula sp. SH-Sr6A]AMV33851.1 Glycine cleavage system H protein [Pirellula sp. SH-Sr6A]